MAKNFCVICEKTIDCPEAHDFENHKAWCRRELLSRQQQQEEEDPQT